jgi:hypothetical protein
VAREPAQGLTTPCPVEIKLGDAPALQPALTADGRATVPLVVPAQQTVVLAVTVAASAARFIVLVRVAFERELPHTEQDSNGGWVLMPPHAQRRFLIPAGGELRAHFDAPGVIRVDVLPDNGEAPEVIAQIAGRKLSLKADGTQVVLPVLAADNVIFEALKGAASIALAERVPRTAADTAQPAHDVADTRTVVAPMSAPTPVSPAQLVLTADALSPSRDAPWAERAASSPPPLSPLAAALGTTLTAVGAVYGTIREGLPYSSSPDAYSFGILGYRRRIESIGLWTDAEVFTRVRAGQPTFGGSLGGYQDLASLHVRVSGELGLAAQQIDRMLVTTWKPQGFVEYSWRVTRNFFVLPRLGYDGFYSPVPVLPKDLTLVDDGVYNFYRAKHPSFVFAQALLWFAPHFNDIFYLRTRASFDPNAANLNHVSARPGLFAAFGDFDLSAFVEGTWRAATSGITQRTTLEQAVGLVATYDLWFGLGSFDVQPGAAGFVRARDGGWQLNVFVNLLASHRRGLRDSSSLTLDFPEQLGGGIPWRGSSAGGYR